MADLSVGDPVRLVAPDLLLEDGATVYEGDKGTVIGFKGFTEVIVSWGTTPPFRVGTCRQGDIARVQAAVRRS